MSRVIQTTVYIFNELSKEAKEKARTWYRDRIANDTYTENANSVIEDATQIGELMGFRDMRIYFSGFWSQGDGACFEGEWRSDHVKPGEVKAYASKAEELHRIAAKFEHIAESIPFSTFTVTRDGCYYHEFCTKFDFRFTDDADNVLDDMEDTEGALIENARNFMRWIYHTLENEWNYQHADEQVDAALICNGYTFTESGQRFG